MTTFKRISCLLRFSKCSSQFLYSVLFNVIGIRFLKFFSIYSKVKISRLCPFCSQLYPHGSLFKKASIYTSSQVTDFLPIGNWFLRKKKFNIHVFSIIINYFLFKGDPNLWLNKLESASPINALNLKLTQCLWRGWDVKN